MSEYQYYEFRAVDRPLTAQEQDELRRYSSRANITPSQFVVSYSWGDFKGDEAKWMEKYFDAFLYMANWGTHQLTLRLPKSALSLETAEQYCLFEDCASARVKGDYVILEFRSDDDESDRWIDDDILDSLVPVRAELASGDLRALYIAWLGCIQTGELGDEELEPPCPPGLGKLSPALEEFASFLRIDDDLIKEAASASAELKTLDDDALATWVAALTEDEKTALLIRLCGGASDSELRGELIRRFRESASSAEPVVGRQARTVGELVKAALSRTEERHRREAEREARKKAQLEREAAEARERHLTALAQREAEAWHDIDTLIATKLPKKYDEATSLLRDLRDVCIRSGRPDEATQRIARLMKEHARKPTLIDRFRKAALF